MQVIYDMPMGVGEPHYAQMIKADKIKALERLPRGRLGSRSRRRRPSSPPQPGEERVERDGNNVDDLHDGRPLATSRPSTSQLKKGDHVIWHITNIETAQDATHGFQLGGYNISLSIEPGETATFEFDADNDGTYPYYCTEFCSALHLEMMGYLLVEP